MRLFTVLLVVTALLGSLAEPLFAKNKTAPQGSGSYEEYPVERHLRDVRFTLIGGGTSEILKLVIAKEICG